MSTPDFLANAYSNYTAPVSGYTRPTGVGAPSAAAVGKKSYAQVVAEGLITRHNTDMAAVKSAVGYVDGRVSANASAIASEASARASAITSAVSAEATARNTAISSAIATEVENRDIAVGQAIQSEVSQRDAAISSAVASESAARDAAISEAIVQSESALRGDIEVVNQELFSTEERLNEAIGTEANLLRGDLANEAARLEGEIALVQGSVSEAVGAEASRLDGEIASLNTRVDNVLANVDAEALNSLSEIAAAFQSADSTIEGTITALQTQHNTEMAALQQQVYDLYAIVQGQ